MLNLDIKRPVIIAGPCSAESEQQVIDTATQLAALGVKIFRAGVWKPRTKPGGFEGVGEPALEWMKEVKARTGMLTAVEVATKAHVEAALRADIDIFWVGARTSANPFAMQELADSLRGSDKTVLVKNPVNPDIELWIGAMQRLQNAGLTKIGAIHRGFSAYGKHIYRNLPQWHIPIELRRRIPDLPIFCDPSHIGGKRELVAPLSQQAMDLGFDGLMIESHCNPDCALSDKNQQITPDVLGLVLDMLVVRQTNESTENLRQLRKQIDTLDDELIELLCKRMRVCREIGTYKREHSMPVLQAGRYDDILSRRIAQAIDLEMGGEFIKTVMEAIHAESVRQQIEILNN